MDVSVVGVLAIGVMAVLLFGGTIVLLAMLLHPKTRPVAAAIFTGGTVLLIMAFLTLFVNAGAEKPSVRTVAMRSEVEPVAHASESEKPPERTPLVVVADESEDDTKAVEEPTEVGDRPKWVDAEPKLVGDVYRMSIVSGPYTTRGECQEHLDEAIQKAAAEYIGEYVGSRAGQVVRFPAKRLRELIQDEWLETREYSVGKMKNQHALLEFDREFNADANEVWREFQVRERVNGMVGVSAIILAGLGMLFGVLKLVGRKKA